MTSFQVKFEPFGISIEIDAGMSLLSAAQDAGIFISAVCGGVGVCQNCKIRCLSGELSEVQHVELDAFSTKELQDGWRLACQAYPRSDLRIEIPLESMATSQRLQVEGILREVPLEPAVGAEDFALEPPDLGDLRADWRRFTEGIGLEPSTPTTAVIDQFSDKMRALDWSGRVLLGEDQQVVGFLEKGQPYIGVAIDIGTTKMAIYVLDLLTGKLITKRGVMNPQIAFGEDVISRIAYANQGTSYRKRLQKELIQTINHEVQQLCHKVGIRTDQVADFVMVGNTAMHHFFMGLPVRQLGEAPYVPAVNQALRVPLCEVGLFGAPGAAVYAPPNIAGYVGGDHIAMLLAADLHTSQDITVAMDIGTNTEISLFKDGCGTCCSCASGPAFEGAHIHAGMRAVPGAIERAVFFDGEWHYTTIDGQKPVGICGSGILDVVAFLKTSGQIDMAGRFTDQAAWLVDHPKGGAIILVPGEHSATGKEILVTRHDIREIQLAKAAIRAGVEALLRATTITTGDIDRFIIAGAFGTYLHIESALQIGMFPGLPLDRYVQVGNAAGAGAQEMLMSTAKRKTAEVILKRMSYLELTTDQGFRDSYVDAMTFE